MMMIFNRSISIPMKQHISRRVMRLYFLTNLFDQGADVIKVVRDGFHNRTHLSKNKICGNDPFIATYIICISSQCLFSLAFTIAVNLSIYEQSRSECSLIRPCDMSAAIQKLQLQYNMDLSWLPEQNGRHVYYDRLLLR